MMTRTPASSRLYLGMIKTLVSTMRLRGQTRMEWALLVVIALVCAILSFLQYRWTGELSRAEPALLRAGLNEQLRLLSQAFNNDLRESCAALSPSPEALQEEGTVKALRRQYRLWTAGH